ncbi:hypothetical protein BS50DRAFT_580091 [Corynespora cassiicola Philippines]|uniref:Uncharacterized protein n=1 Tax=Corynespora cassiicola Philippines TaxID=1448308 RepID=A0A2T2N1H1_CORCC|nr:hypothetical protein BS50DRAFT_580091 [Corynespora cassiicola Philippines]
MAPGPWPLSIASAPLVDAQRLQSCDCFYQVNTTRRCTVSGSFNMGRALIKQGVFGLGPRCLEPRDDWPGQWQTGVCFGDRTRLSCINCGAGQF